MVRCEFDNHVVKRRAKILNRVSDNQGQTHRRLLIRNHDDLFGAGLSVHLLHNAVRLTLEPPLRGHVERAQVFLCPVELQMGTRPLHALTSL